VSADAASDSESVDAARDVDVVNVASHPNASAADRLAAELAGLDLASDDTVLAPTQPQTSNDELLRREVPPHHN